MQAADPDKSLNAGLTGCAAIPSPSSPTVPHASSARGTQAPPTTSSGLDLGSSVHGGLVKYSRGLRQQRTTRWKCQASRDGQSRSATRQLPRPSITTPHQYVLTDSDARRDIPTTKHCTPFFTSPLCPSPCDYKRERRATTTRVRPTERTPFSRDLGSTPSPDQLVTTTKSTPSSGTRPLDTEHRVLLLGGPNQSKSRCLLC
jgi:hypothetical protein